MFLYDLRNRLQVHAHSSLGTPKKQYRSPDPENQNQGKDPEPEKFKAFCEFKSSIPAPKIRVIFNGTLLVEENKSLNPLGIGDSDAVVFVC